MSNLIKILIVFVSFLNLINTKTNDVPTTWTSSELVEYLNENYPGLPNLIFDPHNYLTETTSEKEYLSSLAKSISDNYNVHTYVLVLCEIDPALFDINDLFNNYTFSDPSHKENSTFVIATKSYSQFEIYPGTGLSNIYTREYIKSIETEIEEEYVEGLTYKKFQIILRALNNKFIVPEGGWTPKSLVDFFRKNKTDSKYAFFDPTIQFDIELEKNVSKYFIECSDKNVNTFVFAINEYNNNTNYTSISLFLNDLVTEMKSYLSSSSVNINNTIIIIISALQDEFDMKIGSNYENKLSAEEIKKIRYQIQSKNIKDLMINIRFYLVGELQGWTAEMLNDHLTQYTFIEREKFFLFYKDQSDFSIAESDYISDVLNDLANNQMNVFAFILGKIDSKYSGNLQTFYSEFNNIFAPNSTLIKENFVFFFHSIKDNNKSLIVVHENNKKTITDSINNEIIDNIKPKLSEEKCYFKIIAYVIKSFRFHLIIKDNNFTPHTFADYFVDEFFAPNYTINDDNKTMPEDQEKNKLLPYLSYIYSKKQFSFYYIILNKTHSSYNTSAFTDELFNEFDRTFKPTSQISKKMILIVYFAVSKKFEIKKGSKISEEILEEETIKKILEKSLKEKDLFAQSNTMLKEFKLYLTIINDEWTGESIAEYFKDFIGKVNNYLFDPMKLVDEKNKNTYISPYLNEVFDNSKYNMYCFIIKKGLIIDEESNDELIDDLVSKFELPDNVTVDQTLFITYTEKSQNFNYKIGKKLQLSNEQMDEYIAKSKKYLSTNSSNLYEAFRILLSPIRNKLVIQNDWTPSSLNTFLTKYYKKENIGSYFIFDYYVKLNETQMQELNDIYLKKLSEDNGTNTYVFIVDKIDNKLKETFMDKLYEQFSFSEVDKKNILFILYSYKDRNLLSYPGENKQSYLTKVNLNDLSEKALAKIITDDDIIIGFKNLLSEIIYYSKIPQYFEPKKIEELIKEYYLGEINIIFDPHVALSQFEHIDLNKILNLMSKKNVHVYSFVVNKIENSNDMKDYIKQIADIYPLTKELANQFIIFVVYCTSTKELGILTKNDKKNYLKTDNINNIIKESKEHFNKSLYDGLNYTFNKLKENTADKMKSKNNKLLVCILIGAIGLLIVVLIVIISLRIYNKNKISSTEAEKNNKVTPIFTEDSGFI